MVIECCRQETVTLRDIFRTQGGTLIIRAGRCLAMVWDILESGSGKMSFSIWPVVASGRCGSRCWRLSLPCCHCARGVPARRRPTVLPAGTEFAEERWRGRAELFHSEAIGGRKSYLVNLGDLAFNSPSILGGKARQAEMSCGTCHVNGASNPKLFVAGRILAPRHLRCTSLVFNPKTFNSILDPVRI